MYESYGTIVFDGKVIQDITTRYTIAAKTDSQNLPLFLDYIIKGWESPENIAYKLYGSCNYAWIILLSNNIIIGDGKSTCKELIKEKAKGDLIDIENQLRELTEAVNKLKEILGE